MAESFGAHGWDRYQVFVESERLQQLHDVALAGPAVALLMLVAGSIVSASSAVRRRRAPARSTA